MGVLNGGEKAGETIVGCFIYGTTVGLISEEHTASEVNVLIGVSFYNSVKRYISTSTREMEWLSPT